MMVISRPSLCILAIVVRVVNSSPPGGIVNASYNTTSTFLKAQSSNPNDTITILLLLGGEIIQKAIAQLAGTMPLVPVAFSFGWVNFAFYNLLAALGDGYLMPHPPMNNPVLLINVDSGYPRNSSSWVLDQFLKSVETEVGTTLAPL